MKSIGDDKDYDDKIIMKADSKQSDNDVREYGRKTQKVGSIAKQGEYQQGGMLSSRQVEMYKNLLKEMEDLHGKQQQRLLKAEQQYSKQLETEQRSRIDNLQRLKDEVEKNQSNYDRVSGSLRGAGVDGSSGYASPNIVGYHEAKLSESIKTYEDYKTKVDSDMDLPKSLQDLDSQISKLTSSLEKMDINKVIADDYSSRINNMSMQPDSGLYSSSHRALSQMTGSLGLMLGVGSYMNYTRSGMGLLRSEEEKANVVTQKLGLNTTDNADSDFRDEAVSLGEKLGFNATQTLGLQNLLLTGGTATTTDLQKDTSSLQEFSRAYEVDPMQMAMGTTMLQKMGTFQEGEMQRFANLIAGAISKSDMGGREEEMMRSTLSLASAMSQGLSELSSQQLMEGVGLQAQIGEAVPTLKGERGTNILSGLNNALKSGVGNQNLELLMGKGVEFTGYEGMEDLWTEMEKGLTNENLQRLLVHGSRMTGGLDNPIIKRAFKELSGNQLTISNYNELLEAGILDDWKDGNFLSPEELEDRGMTAMADQLKQSGNSATSEIRNVDAQSSNFKGDNAKPAEEIATASRGMFHELPTWTKMGLMGAGSIFGNYLGGKLIDKGARGVTKAFSPKVGSLLGGGGTSALASGASNALATAGSIAKDVALPVGIATGGVALANTVGNMRSNQILSYKEESGTSSGYEALVQALLRGDKKDFNKSLQLYAHEKGSRNNGELLDSLNEDFSGLKDYYKQDVIQVGAWNENAFYKAFQGMNGDSNSSNKTTLKVDSLEVRKTDSLGDTVPSSSARGQGENTLTEEKRSSSTRKYEEEVNKPQSGRNFIDTDSEQEQVIRVIIEGGIEGMSPNNEEKVTTSLVDYFSQRINLSNQFLRK